MILLLRAVRVYMATEPVNLRRSFDGLMNEVRSVLALDPLSGHICNHALWVPSSRHKCRGRSLHDSTHPC
jgi:hypothetical protein